jgi:uncharacterized protein (TIGR00369 family)
MHNYIAAPPAAHGQPRLTAQAVDQMIHVHFPQVHFGGQIIFIDQLGERSATLRMKAVDRIIRPGGTISGPAMFTLADVGIWVLLLAELGEHALQAVTTNLNLNFLSRPAPVDMLCEARILKLGRRLAVGEIELRSEGHDELIAHATGTYAIPPEKR